MHISVWRIAASLVFLGLTAFAVQAATPLRIAFVDTGNTGRSMTSASLAQKWASDNNANVVVISRAVNLNPYNGVPEPDFVMPDVNPPIVPPTVSVLEVTV